MQIEVSEDGFIAASLKLNGGALVEELDRALMKCVGAIQDHGGSAAMTLKINIKRIPGMATAVSITADEVATKVPKEERLGKVLFITPGCGLTDQHQKQESLELGDAVDHQRQKLTPVASISKGDK